MLRLTPQGYAQIFLKEKKKKKKVVLLAKASNKAGFFKKILPGLGRDNCMEKVKQLGKVNLKQFQVEGWRFFLKPVGLELAVLKL